MIFKLFLSAFLLCSSSTVYAKCGDAIKNHDCAERPDIWAYIVIAIILMVIYAYVSSKYSDWKIKKDREANFSQAENSIKKGVAYNVILNNGHKFTDVEIIGVTENENDEIALSDWAGLFVLVQNNGKRIFVKKPSIRFIEEI